MIGGSLLLNLKMNLEISIGMNNLILDSFQIRRQKPSP